MKNFVLFTVILVSITISAFSQIKNSITLDINPELSAIFFNVSKVKGFGFGLGYERVLTKNFSIGLDEKFTYLTSSEYDARFFSIYINLHERYYVFSAPEKLFFDTSLGGLWHSSPFQKSFMLSFGSSIGWKYIIKGHFIAEPYIGWAVFSGDKYLAPWSIIALTEIIMPGFYMGVLIGWAF